VTELLAGAFSHKMDKSSLALKPFIQLIFKPLLKASEYPFSVDIANDDTVAFSGGSFDYKKLDGIDSLMWKYFLKAMTI